MAAIVATVPAATGNGGATPPVTATKAPTLTKSQNLIAGGVASCASKTAFAPFQRIIVLRQLGEHPDKNYRQLYDYVVNKNGGFAGFWRGNLASMIQRFPYSGLQLVLYDSSKVVIQNSVGYRAKPANDGLVAQATHMAQSLVYKSGAAFFAAIVASTVTYPMDVVRTRMMSGDNKYKSLIETIKIVYHEEPYGRNFFRGCNAMLIQRVPDMMINFSVYESVKERLLNQGYGKDASIFVGSSAAALTSVAFLFPLDVAKRRIAQAKSRADGVVYKSTWLALKMIYKEQGVRGLYVGGALEAIRVVPQVAFMWYATEVTRDWFRARNQTNASH